MKNNYLKIISKYFNKKEFIKNNLNKIINVRYGFNNIKTIRMIKSKEFQDFYNQHLTQSYLKTTYKEVWKKEEKSLNEACKNKFRADNDIGSQICRYWQLLSGKFMPSKIMGKYYEISNNNSKIINAIKKRKYKIICINDAKANIDFEKAKKEINTAFEKTFVEKSSFEK